MKGSQELIAYFNKREDELKEKATKLNMFLEGYAVGHNDTKAFMIDKACRMLCKTCEVGNGSGRPCIKPCHRYVGFKKGLEE